MKFIKDLSVFEALLGLYVAIICKYVMILGSKSVENSFAAFGAVAKIEKLNSRHYFLDQVTHLIEL